MNKWHRPVTIRFVLVQPEGVARTWADSEITRVLAEFIRIWAETVDGQVDHLLITVLKPDINPSS